MKSKRIPDNEQSASPTGRAIPSYWPGVQYLRGYCAMLVLVSHANGIMGKPEEFAYSPLPDIHIASLFAVAAFFAISGFIIMVASVSQWGTPTVTGAEFLRRRVVRIIPFLWVCVIGYNLLSAVSTGSIIWSEMWRALVIWPVGDLKPNVVWSLRHEWLFYVGFSLFAVRWPNLRWLLIAFLCASAVFYFLVDNDRVLPFSSSAFDWIKFFAGGDHGANFQFAVGAAFAQAVLAWSWAKVGEPENSVGRLLSRPLATLTAFLAGAALVMWLPSMTSLATAIVWTLSVVPSLALAVSARSADRPSAFSRLSIALGNASFAIYLVHNPVILVGMAAWRFVLPQAHGTIAFALLLTGLCLSATIAGLLVHRWVERPLIRAINRRTSRKRARETAAIVDESVAG